MATLSEIRTTVNAWLAAWLPKFPPVQEAYRQQHGHYFQGLQTHATPPADGALVAPDIALTTPGDQPVAWRHVIPPESGYDISDPMPCALRLDVWDSGQAQGWILTAQFVADGVTYQKSYRSDTGTWSDWAAVPDEPL
jgi:hypothetical protein